MCTTALKRLCIGVQGGRWCPELRERGPDGATGIANIAGTRPIELEDRRVGGRQMLRVVSQSLAGMCGECPADERGADPGTRFGQTVRPATFNERIEIGIRYQRLLGRHRKVLNLRNRRFVYPTRRTDKDCGADDGRASDARESGIHPATRGAGQVCCNPAGHVIKCRLDGCRIAAGLR